MALKDLKSDLTKAFNRKPAGGKLEKMLENPNSSQLNYDSKPKPYKIPNDGRGAQVRYDQQSESYKTQSRLGEIQNTGNISGRFNTSDIEPVKSELGGRHENVDITLNELAKTPAKTAVEPIAMSATPVKQGTTPTLMPATAEKVGITPNKMKDTPEKIGTDINKIPLTKNVENQSPEIDDDFYGFSIGEGVLAELGQIQSALSIEDIPQSYADIPIISHFGENDIKNPLSGNIFEINASISGYNIPAPYTISPTFEVNPTTSSKWAYHPNSDVDFFTGPVRYHPSWIATNNPTAHVGSSDYYSGTISLDTQQVSGVNFFRPEDSNNVKRVLETKLGIPGFTTNITNDQKYITTAPTPANSKYPLNIVQLESHSEPRGITDLQSQIYRNLTTQLTLMPTDGSASQTFFDGINTWSYTTAWNAMLTGGQQLTNPYVTTYTIQGGTTLDEIPDTTVDGVNYQDFFANIDANNNFKIFTLDGVTHTNKYADTSIIQIDDSQYWIPELTSSPWQDINLVNFLKKPKEA